VAGAAVGWLRDGLGIIAQASEVGPLAASVPDAGGVVFVPALAGLGTPDWDPEARGLLIGLSRGTTRAHVARATLEGIAASVADVVTSMEADAGSPLTALRVDGGASGNDLLLAIQADLLGVPVERPVVQETTALGAALLAGRAAGLFHDAAALEEARRIERRFEPSIDATERRSRLARWRDAVERSKRWARA
jgi:glycerol kinase